MVGFVWEVFMRVLSKEYQEHLKKNEIYQFIVNHPKPDFEELEKIEDTYEDDMLRKYEESKVKETVYEN